MDYGNFLCYRISTLARKIAKAHNLLCTEYGITASQSFVLFDLLKNEGSSVKEIAANLQLDSPAITGYVDRLIKEDLVYRAEDSADRRVYRLYLTDKGRKLAEILLPKTRELHLKIIDIIENDSDALERAITKLEKELLQD
ncbi:MAG: MarR family transcriptional regulator [Syntrophomonadaceae bacterium]|jgi:DNA-binding MarR family transcriptional regulator|nr:MarR family transcriptional regulator [Syntrophomonadaceae bacterium]